MQPWNAALALSLLVAGSLLSPGLARAHAGIDAALARYDEGELEAALRSAEAVLATGSLAREELAQIYTLQALVHHAMGAEDERDRALVRLGTLVAPDGLDPRIPPPLRARLEELRDGAGPLALVVTADRGGASVTLEARVERDRAGLVERVDIAARSASSREWQVGDRGRVTVLADDGEEVAYWAQAIGPSGSVVASDGSEEDPRILSETADAVAATEGSDDTVWIVLGVVAAVLVAGAAVGIAVGVSQSGGEPQVGPPMIEW